MSGDPEGVPSLEPEVEAQDDSVRSEEKDEAQSEAMSDTEVRRKQTGGVHMDGAKHDSADTLHARHSETSSLAQQLHGSSSGFAQQYPPDLPDAKTGAPTLLTSTSISPSPGPAVSSTDAKPIIREFPCPFPGCGKVFSKKFNMQTHMRLHSGVKPYVCSKGCGTAFMWMSSRNRHEAFCGQGYYRHRRSGSAPPLSAERPRFTSILPSPPPVAMPLPPPPAPTLPGSLSNQPIAVQIPQTMDPELVFEPSVSEPNFDVDLECRDSDSPRRTRSYNDARMEDSPKEKDVSPHRKTLSLEQILDFDGVALERPLPSSSDSALGHDVVLPNVLVHDNSELFREEMASVALDEADIPPKILDQDDDFKDFL